jgi:two-component system chemotaxis sensor kinase CheA
MRMRLLPISHTFRRFLRPVRDLAASLGKDVAFRTEGEATEADKRVVENLFEPLLHVLRNALDHGIEPPAERVAAGKLAQAELVLRARAEGERILVEVEDDGRGIDPARIRRSAVERGLVTAEGAAALTDAEAIDLIFAPGFSTASTVSDISGRGVGMDAVRAAVQQLGGRVGVTSRPGRGTTICFTLPATIVLTRLLTVAVGTELFGIPLEAVSETVRVPRERILAIRDGRATVLRDRTVPVLDLADLLSLPERLARAGDAALLVTGQAGEPVAIEVDGFGERFEAILKPADGLLEGVPWIAGTTLLGTGRVLLVLDLAQVIG